MKRVILAVAVGISLVLLLSSCSETQILGTTTSGEGGEQETEPDIIWQKSLGGSGSDGANSIQQTSDGGYIVAGVTGSSDGDVSGNHGNGDFWIVKLGW